MRKEVINQKFIRGYLRLCLFLYCFIIVCCLFLAYNWYTQTTFYFIRNFTTVLQLIDYIKAGVVLSLIILLAHFLINAIEMILEKRMFNVRYFILTFTACLLNVILLSTLFQNVNFFLRIAVTNQQQFLVYLSTYLTISIVVLVLSFVNVVYLYRMEMGTIYQ